MQVTISNEDFMKYLNIFMLILIVLNIFCFLKDKELKHEDKVEILSLDIIVIIIYGIINLANADMNINDKFNLVINIIHYISLGVATIPLIYNILNFMSCTQTILARCIDVKEHTTPSNDEDNPHDYHVTTTFKYKYEFNDKEYYFETSKSKKTYLENTYHNDDNSIFNTSKIEINTFTDEYGSSLPRNQVNKKYDMNIKINPNNPKQHRLKNNGFSYTFISIIGIFIFILTKMLLRYL
ncbi:MAG: hypothetical protein ACI4WH_02095 [Oscillospiraceae bacterium]